MLSSGYRIYLNRLEHFMISFMNIKNRRGFTIDYSGTPYLIGLGLEFTLLLHLYCFPFVKYERNQLQAIPRHKYLLLITVSLEKSKTRDNAILSESMFLYISVRNVISE